DDLVDVTERDVRQVHAKVHEQTDLLERAGPALAVGQDRRACAQVRGRGGLEDPCVPGGWAVQAAGDLDHTRPMRCPSDDRPRVVEVVDATGDVEREELREGIDVETVTPVSRSVIAVMVEAGRGDDVDSGPPR